MGTVVSIHVHRGGCSRLAATEAIAASCARLHELEAIFTTFDATSPMSLLRAGALALQDAPAVIPEVLELCDRARSFTNGWFDPWSAPGGVDPTGLVKGWAIEQAAAILKEAKVAGALVNGGGDIALVGAPPDGGPWRIGIQHPWRRGALACVVEVGAAAVATSGAYARRGHLADWRGGRVHARVASASVIGDSLAFADAFATAIAVGGADAARSLGGVDGFDAYWIESDGTEHSTPGVAFG